MTDENDDYLWDRRGERDPEVAGLEDLLGGLAYDRPAPAIVVPRKRTARGWIFAGGGLAAAAVVVIMFAPRTRHERAQVVKNDARGWTVASTAGRPSCGSQRCEDVGLRVGEWLETDDTSEAQVSVADIGSILVAPRSRLRLKRTGPDEHRLELAQGTISAHVSAPPRLLVVETPSATAVDLGCAYTLTVDPGTGAGHLIVTSGEVALELPGHTAYVPHGAACESRRGQGLGTPHRSDASPALVAALARYDFEQGGDDALATVIREASRREDSISLWHLLYRATDAQRVKLYYALLDLGPLPVAAVTRDTVLAMDATALEAWRRQLRPYWFQH